MPGIVSQIEDLSKMKGIDPSIVTEAVKDAILVAARKYFRSNEDFVAEINPESGNIEVFAVKTVSNLVANPAREISLNDARKVDPNAEIGGLIRFRKQTEGLGRISAQMAKQVIFQKIREAERDTICVEFQDRLGQLETCTVKRSEGPDLIVDLGRTEGRLPRREQSKLESFSPGDRIRVIIKSLERAGRGPAVIVSRASEELVKRLFEQEVPEIYDGTVEIRACAREAGERTKIAVRSNDRDVDAVGACVGMKGMRVQSIIRELRGEKIDIIEFSEDPVELATRGLSPARISRVAVLDPAQRHLEVVVDELQLSLAIGKKGQNVRLASKLVGWRIDIKSEDQKRQEVETAMAAFAGAGTPVSVLIDFGLTDEVVDRLLEADSKTVESLADMTPEQLQAIPGITPETLSSIQMSVNAYYQQFEQAQAAPDLTDPNVVFGPLPEEQAAQEGAAAGANPLAPAKSGGFVPGLPVEGADDDEDEEDLDEIEFEDEDAGDEDEESEGDFDNMDEERRSESIGVSSRETSQDAPPDGQEPRAPVASETAALNEDEGERNERVKPEE